MAVRLSCSKRGLDGAAKSGAQVRPVQRARTGSRRRGRNPIQRAPFVCPNGMDGQCRGGGVGVLGATRPGPAINWNSFGHSNPARLKALNAAKASPSGVRQSTASRIVLMAVCGFIAGGLRGMRGLNRRFGKSPIC